MNASEFTEVPRTTGCKISQGIGSHLKKEQTASHVLTKLWKLELTMATNFGSHAQMVTKFGGQILANKFGFVPDCSDCGVEISVIVSRKKSTTQDITPHRKNNADNGSWWCTCILYYEVKFEYKVG